jgi:hypothetical protein
MPPTETACALTVQALVALYLRHTQSEGVHGPEARADRERTLTWFCTKYGTQRVADLKPYHLTDWIEEHPEWSPSRPARAKANAVRACFNWAATGGRIERNPFSPVRYGEADRRPDMPDACWPNWKPWPTNATKRPSVSCA